MRLRGLIETLAARFDSDVFDPHVTLIGSLTGDEDEIAGRARALARRFLPFDITLGDVVCRPASPDRYRRLFALVETTTTLTAVATAARAAFGIDSGAYEPHLSLAYADLAPPQFEALSAQASRAGVAGIRFAVGALELWRTDGAVAEWRLAASFPPA